MVHCFSKQGAESFWLLPVDHVPPLLGGCITIQELSPCRKELVECVKPQYSSLEASVWLTRLSSPIYVWAFDRGGGVIPPQSGRFFSSCRFSQKCRSVGGGGGGYVIPFRNLQEMAVSERYGLGGGG